MEELRLRKQELLSSAKFVIFNRDDFKCAYCGASSIEDGVKLHIDHIQPFSKTKDSNIYNLITACSECNSSKNNKILNADVYDRIVRRNTERNQGITQKSIDLVNEILGDLNKNRKTAKEKASVT
jgi:5-methylcytosine-specific restriction endonuclease McrA